MFNFHYILIHFLLVIGIHSYHNSLLFYNNRVNKVKISYNAVHSHKPDIPITYQERLNIENRKIATTSIATLSTFISLLTLNSKSVLASSSSTISTSSATNQNDLDALITDKVYIDIKIANYTEESVGKNREASGSGKIIIGLYGKIAPVATKNFISLITGDGDNLPCYKKSLFNRK